MRPDIVTLRVLALAEARKQQAAGHGKAMTALFKEALALFNVVVEELDYEEKKTSK